MTLSKNVNQQKYKRIYFKILSRLYDRMQRLYTLTVRRYLPYIFNQTKLQYSSHQYNYSWVNERSVEIPVFQKILKKFSPNHHILEVGNVLGNYQPIFHQVVDKYEKTEGVINLDVLDFKPKNHFDLIISISTLEHVGWDETNKQKTKIMKAINHLKSLLKTNGQLWFSVPVGYNPYLDKLIKQNKLPLTKVYYLRRTTGFSNIWKQVKKIDADKCQYGHPFPHANTVMIGYFKNAK